MKNNNLMKCAIQLIFDDKSQKILSNFRKQLVQNGVHDEAVPFNHISIADIEISNDEQTKIQKIINELAKHNDNFSVKLIVCGSFMTDENVLFIAPAKDSNLIKLNNDLIKLLSKEKIECNKHYIGDNWQPHTTLAIRLSDEELFKGFELVKKSRLLPLDVSIIGIDLLRYDTRPNFEELYKVNLGTNREKFISND